MPQPRRILISGYYGLRNTGDEAVLSAIISGLKMQIPEAEITVLSASPEETARDHGVRALRRMSPSVVLKAVRNCDLLISGGGSLLQDATSFLSLAYYLLIIGLAKRYRKKTMILGQGIGPLRRRISRVLTARALNGVSMITVRDAQSGELLREIGVKGRIETCADPTLMLEACADDETDKLMREAGLGENEEIIAVSLRGWAEAPELERKASDALKTLAEQMPVRFLLVTMQTPGDADMAQRIAAGMSDRSAVQPGAWTAEQLLGVLGRCSFVLAMRLHALIFAAAADVPSLGIIYDPKVEQFVRMTGQAGVTLEDVSNGHLARETVRAYGERGRLSEALGGSLPAMRSAAAENFRLAAETLSSEKPEFSSD